MGLRTVLQLRSGAFYSQPDHNAALNRTRGSLKVLYEKVAAGKKLLVQYSPGVLPPADLLGLPKESVVLEISGDVPADGELLKWCQDFKEGGRLLALSQVDWPADASHPLLELADLLKVDLKKTSPEDQEELLNRFAGRPVNLLAENLETREEFRLARQRD